MGGRQYLLKTSMPLHLIKIYQMRPLLAGSLDSIFNERGKLSILNHVKNLNFKQLFKHTKKAEKILKNLSIGMALTLHSKFTFT
jgi:hypothetical protein